MSTPFPPWFPVCPHNALTRCAARAWLNPGQLDVGAWIDVLDSTDVRDPQHLQPVPQGDGTDLLFCPASAAVLATGHVLRHWHHTPGAEFVRTCLDRVWKSQDGLSAPGLIRLLHTSQLLLPAMPPEARMHLSRFWEHLWMGAWDDAAGTDFTLWPLLEPTLLRAAEHEDIRLPALRHHPFFKTIPEPTADPVVLDTWTRLWGALAYTVSDAEVATAQLLRVASSLYERGKTWNPDHPLADRARWLWADRAPLAFPAWQADDLARTAGAPLKTTPRARRL